MVKKMLRGMLNPSGYGDPNVGGIDPFETHILSPKNRKYVWTKHSILAGVTCILVFCFILSVHAEEAELVKNGSFEIADTDSLTFPAYWKTSVSGPDSENSVKFAWENTGYSGKRCISVYTDNTRVTGIWIIEKLAVEPNCKYNLKFYYKCDTTGKGPASILILGENGVKICDVYLKEPTAWTQFDYAFDTKDTKFLTIQLWLYQREKQKYYFDDVNLKEVK